MPLFDITSGIKARYKTGAMPPAAYDIMKKIVVTFAKRGYAVDWREQRPPERVVARLTDKDGTDLLAEVDVVDEGTLTRCDVHIHGHVFLGGLLGRLVSASTIQSRAQDKIKELLDEHFAGQPAKHAPAPAGSVPAPAGAAAARARPAGGPPAGAPSARHAVTPTAPPPSKPAQGETWQALSEGVLAGRPAPEPAVIIRRAAAAAGALGDAMLIQFVQLALVQALACSRGNKLDKAAAAQLLARIAPSPAQVEMASSAKGKLGGTHAAYALTAALGEVALRSFDDDAPGDEALRDLFGAAFERVRGERVAAQRDGSSSVVERFAQVQEAYDADLISEAEMLVLKERVLATG